MLNKSICPVSLSIDEYVNDLVIDSLFEPEDLVDSVMEGRKLVFDKFPERRVITQEDCFDHFEIARVTKQHYASGYHAEELGELIDETIRKEVLERVREALSDYECNPEIL